MSSSSRIDGGAQARAQSEPTKLWRVRPSPAAIPTGEWPPLIGRLLANRGARTDAEARAFLSLEAKPATPLALPDLEVAVGRLSQACRDSEAVAVFGDFDVDGITAAALLTEGLTSLGARPIPYLPHRDSEGYGLNSDAIASLHELGATLLVTADCGTSSVKEIAFARERGLDVIILDHHSVPPLLPGADAIVNPKRDESLTDEPAACGIAYYVLAALHQALGQPADQAGMLELVALGTVCDMAPLVGENRRLVRDGLSALAKTQRAGLKALLEVSGVDPARVDAEAIGFALGPRLNAAGRLAHSRLAFDLLLERDGERARDLAGELDALNRARREATAAAVALAEELVAEESEASLLMVGHPEFAPGIVGLVAARLVESRHRPAVVYHQGELESRASARSIEGFDVTRALRTCAELFVRFGGHRMAAGFTAENEQLAAIKSQLQARAEEELAGRELTPAIEVDAELPLAALRGEEIRWLNRLAPHGVGNPEPSFLSRNVLVAECRRVGQDGQHLRLKLRDGPVAWPAIAFRQQGNGIEEGARIDLVYTIAADRLRPPEAGGLQLRVLDLQPAGV